MLRVFKVCVKTLEGALTALLYSLCFCAVTYLLLLTSTSQSKMILLVNLFGSKYVNICLFFNVRSVVY